MTKICPLSMAGEPTECYEDDCNGYINGDCYLNNISLSLYFCSKNMQNISADVEDMADNIEGIR